MTIKLSNQISNSSSLKTDFPLAQPRQANLQLATRNLRLGDKD